MNHLFWVTKSENRINIIPEFFLILFTIIINNKLKRKEEEVHELFTQGSSMGVRKKTTLETLGQKKKQAKKKKKKDRKKHNIKEVTKKQHKRNMRK
jgi:hypothetical protein